MPIRSLVVVLTLALVAAACGDGDDAAVTTAPRVNPSEIPSTTAPSSGASDETPPDVAFIASAIPRRVPSADAEDLERLAAGSRLFAVDLYDALRFSSDGNLAFSPLSIQTALAMTFAGAEGTTAVQIADALRSGIYTDRLHRAFNALDQALAERNIELPPGPDDVERKVELSVANALWGQSGFAFEPDFLDTLAAEYGAGMNLVDFTTAAEAARAAINEWVGAETNDRITELIGPGVLSELTRLVLTNAVYLDATWATMFDPARTAPGPFTLLDGSTVDAELMRNSLEALYAEGEGWQAVELPYVGEELAMLLVVPDAGSFSDVETSIGSIMETQMRLRQVALALPRFEFRSQVGLVEPLRELGMVDAFDRALADFSGMTGDRDLYVSDVLHETFVSVDEQGTEAAAATAVVMDLRAATIDPVVLEIDRPFFFVLRDRPTGAVLFFGRLLDPTT